jgi:hypothetical protein
MGFGLYNSLAQRKDVPFLFGENPEEGSPMGMIAKTGDHHFANPQVKGRGPSHSRRTTDRSASGWPASVQ